MLAQAANEAHDKRTYHVQSVSGLRSPKKFRCRNFSEFGQLLLSADSGDRELLKPRCHFPSFIPSSNYLPRAICQTDRSYTLIDILFWCFERILENLSIRAPVRPSQDKRGIFRSKADAVAEGDIYIALAGCIRYVFQIA